MQVKEKCLRFLCSERRYCTCFTLLTCCVYLNCQQVVCAGWATSLAIPSSGFSLAESLCHSLRSRRIALLQVFFSTAKLPSFYPFWLFVVSDGGLCLNLKTLFLTNSPFDWCHKFQSLCIVKYCTTDMVLHYCINNVTYKQYYDDVTLNICLSCIDIFLYYCLLCFEPRPSLEN